MYVISSPRKWSLYGGSRIRRTCRLHVLHVGVYALMVRTCKLVRAQPYTAPAAGDLVSGNRWIGQPHTYLPGKFPTAWKQCGFNLFHASPVLLFVSRFWQLMSHLWPMLFYIKLLFSKTHAYQNFMSLIARQAWMNHHSVGMNHHLLWLTHWHSFFFSEWPINWNWEYRFAINCNCNIENAINCDCTSENAINTPGLLQIFQLIVIAVNMLAPLSAESMLWSLFCFTHYITTHY